MHKEIILLMRHFTLNSGSYAGFFEEFAKHAYSKGYKILIICARIDSGLPEHESLGFAEVRRFPIPKVPIPLIGANRDYLFLAGNIRRFFKGHNCENTMIVGNALACLGAPMNKYILRMGQPASVFLKNMEMANSEVSMVTRTARKFHYTFQSRLERSCARNARGFIFPSYETKEAVYKLYNIKDKPYLVPQSGINFDNYSSGKNLQYQGKIILFISAGEEKIRKGVVYLEKALPEIFDKYPDAKLLHVGDKGTWNLPSQYQNKIISVGKVKWSEMKDYYASADVMVSTALNEGMPNAILEAMAAGLPIVTSDINGVEEYMGHMKGAYVYQKNNAAELVKGVSFMLDNPLKAKKMAEISKEMAKRLSYPDYFDKLLNYLENAYSKPVSVNLLK